MSLNEQLQARKEQSAARRNPDVRRILDDAIDAVDSSALAEQALAVGETAPDFELPDARGGSVASADLLAEGPLVVSFYRGGWCPYCHLELRALQERLGDIQSAGGSLVAISPQTPEASRATAEQAEVSFPVLSDIGNRVASAFGLVHKLSPDVIGVYRDDLGIDLTVDNAQPSGTWELPLPATFVLDPDGRVVFAFAKADYTQRAEPDDVVAALEGLRSQA